MYDKVVNICPECADINFGGHTLDWYGVNFQEEMYYQVKSGWRPPQVTSSFDYNSLASIVGDIELGIDTYNQFESLLGREALPGPLDLSLVLIQAGIENRDESMIRIGYEMLAAALIDTAVDAGAGYAAVKVGGIVMAGTGGNPVAGAIAGGVTFLAIEYGFDTFVGPHVDRAVDGAYEHIQYELQVDMQSNLHGTPNAYGPGPVPVRTPSPIGTPVP